VTNKTVEQYYSMQASFEMQLELCPEWTQE